MPIDLNTAKGPVNLDTPQMQDVFADLQGNILNGHGRDHALHLFLAFNLARIHDVRQRLAAFTSRYVTSAKAQLEGSRRYKKTGEDAGTFAHLALSGAGYQALGLPPPQGAALRNRPTTIDVNNQKMEFYDPDVFAQGMKKRRRMLQDPEIADWEAGFREEIHLLLLIADDDNLTLIEMEKRVRDSFEVDSTSPVARILAVERGFGLRKRFYEDGPKFGENVEHFGYVDGRSQPVLLDTHLDEELKRDGTRVWNPVADPSLVLIQDPLGSKGTSFGSFLVFRKLEQNVLGFKKAERDLGKELGLSPELVGAMAVGRFEDGSPVVLQPGDDSEPALANDFDYAGDKAGLKCPFHAHIRKANPRLESVLQGGSFAQSSEEELGHRIARRGIPYGGKLSNFSDIDNLPTQGVGLLFMCYQSDIWEQFEFIQRFWCNNERFLQPGLRGTAAGAQDYVVATGMDSVIGQQLPQNIDPLTGFATPPRNWPSQWNKSTRLTTRSISQFVTLKGGEYFFSPSISFLLSLSKPIKASSVPGKSTTPKPERSTEKTEVSGDETEVREESSVPRPSGRKHSRRLGR